MKILTVDECMAVSGSMGGGGQPGPGMQAANNVMMTAMGGGIAGLAAGPLGGALGAVGGFMIGYAQFGGGGSQFKVMMK